MIPSKPVDTPIFGVVIPSYNRPHDLNVALASLVAQTYENWLTIVVDDASPVEYTSTVANFDDKRIKYLRQKQNTGINGARNTGIQFLIDNHVDFITFLDDDDEFTPDFFEQSIRIMEKHPGYEWYMSNNCGERKRSEKRIETTHEMDWINDYIYGKFRGDKAHIFSAEALKTIKMDARYRSSNRWQFFIDMGERTKILAHPHPSIKKRYQEGGITKGEKGAYKGPKNCLEVYSRFGKHAYVLKKRPFKLIAYKYLLLELLKTPRRLIRLWSVKNN